MIDTLRAAGRIAGKEIRIELRTREIVVTTGLFAVLVVVTASLSFYVDRAASIRMAPGVLWIAIAFSGVLAMSRSWAREREQDVMRALLMAPVPRAAIYLGKAASVAVFMAAVEVVIVPLVALLFRLDLTPVLGRIVLLLVLGTVGFVAAGTLFASMTVRTRARDLLLSVVIFPLIAPTLLAGVVATRGVLGGAPWAETIGWMRILLASDVIFLAAGAVLFEPLVSE